MLANFLQGDIPLLSITWSLSVEEQYYLLWPPMLVLLPVLTIPRAAVLGGLILVCLAAMLGIADILDLPRLMTDHAVFRLPAMSYMAILMGSLVAVLLHDGRSCRLLWAICGPRAAPPILFALLLAYLQFAPVDLHGWPALGMDILMALTVAALVIREDHFARPVMTLRPVVRIGEISYGLYLYHLIGLHVANQLTGQLALSEAAHEWIVSATFPVLSIAMAEISFRYFERHFLAWKDSPGSKSSLRANSA